MTMRKYRTVGGLRSGRMMGTFSVLVRSHGPRIGLQQKERQLPGGGGNAALPQTRAHEVRGERETNSEPVTARTRGSAVRPGDRLGPKPCEAQGCPVPRAPTLSVSDDASLMVV